MFASLQDVACVRRSVSRDRRGHHIGTATGIVPRAISIFWEESTNDPLDLRR